MMAGVWFNKSASFPLPDRLPRHPTTAYGLTGPRGRPRHVSTQSPRKQYVALCREEGFRLSKGDARGYARGAPRES